MTKVELLVNLKVADGRIINAGTIFTDESGPIPDFVIRRLNRGMARILSQSSPLPETKVTKEEVKKEREASASPAPQPGVHPTKITKQPVKVQNQKGPASTEQGVVKDAVRKPIIRKPIPKK